MVQSNSFDENKKLFVMSGSSGGIYHLMPIESLLYFIYGTGVLFRLHGLQPADGKKSFNE
jgi:hypothetical protein